MRAERSRRKKGVRPRGSVVERLGRLEGDMTKRARAKGEEKTEDELLTASIDAIYRKYGTNLAAFYRDIHDDMAKAERASGSGQRRG
jgi:hypothetical protein